MSRRLIGYVHVGGVAYGPGDEVPASVAKRIGDHAWTDAPDVEDVGQIEDDDQGDGSGGDVEAPPRSGRGSGLDAWLAFADAHEVGTDSDMTRDDVIAACEAAGVIEPEQPKE